MKMEQSVPKGRYINSRRRGITQKKAYNNLYIVCLLLRWYIVGGRGRNLGMKHS